ncbi:MAG TPA: transcription antitermination factor NusB [Gammaproteobacteria bacterium]|nr:transcription antitermination factor NusB [Gammaproteobacteria bacterium]
MSRARSKARRAAVQALYQWQVSRQDVGDIEQQFLAEQDMRKLEVPYFQELLHQVPARLDELDDYISPLLDRPLNEVDPVERAILRLGAYELGFRLDIPYRVVINEAVEIAKTFGGEEGYKYVNGILDKLAQKLRSTEIRARGVT